VYTEVATESFLRHYVPVARHELVHSLEGAERAAKKIGFPLVLKLISLQALHKSEVTGVRFVHDLRELAQEYEQLLAIVQKRKFSLQGILVQEYVDGVSTLIGLKRDPVFGHAIAFGIGGTYTELLKDVTFRICPLTEKDAKEMIMELHMKDLLFGYRGSPPVNISLLKKTLVTISRIPLRHPEISEMDINPFVLSKQKGFVVDARMVTSFE